MKRHEIKQRVYSLRRKGKTYREIQQLIGIKIPKGTLSYWCRSVSIPIQIQKVKQQKQITDLAKARTKALRVLVLRNHERIRRIREKNKLLVSLMNRPSIAKIALVFLYLGEGSKSPRLSSLVFGNSDPRIIKSFLKLLGTCYPLDESKFRCTVQCRADQNPRKLVRYWSKLTGIPLGLFYKTQIDPRSVGKPTRKKDYKGVCRINYFSAQIFHELRVIGDVLTMGL